MILSTLLLSRFLRSLPASIHRLKEELKEAIKKQEQNQDIANRNLRKVSEELTRINRQLFELNKKSADQEAFDHDRNEVIDAGFASVNSKVDDHLTMIQGLASMCNGLTTLTVQMQGRYDAMENEIDVMQDHLCHCEQTIPIEEEGGLEYESSDSFVIAPVAPSSSTPSAPRENASPIPIPPPLPSSSSDVENIAPPVADRPATPFPVCHPLRTLHHTPYHCRGHYPHTIATGVVVNGVRYHRVEDIPRR